MDFKTLKADINLFLNKHFTFGRSGHKIDKIVLHHNAGNLSVEGCYSVWQTREASAHYQVQNDGIIGQLVHDWDTAWHAGDAEANMTSIGIEHANNHANPWTISEKCLDSGAHLVAALCIYYKLGEPEWLVNVFPHSYFCPTSCPGEIAGSQNAEYMARAKKYYAEMTGKTIKPDVDAEKPTKSKNKIEVDGLWGPATTRKAQQVFGTYVDGIVSNQYASYKSKNPGLLSSTFEWKYDPASSGSPLIKAIQKKVGAKQDGFIGDETIKLMQKWLGTYQDGIVDNPSPMVRAFQTWLNKQ